MHKMCENLALVASMIGEFQLTKYLKPFISKIGNKVGFWLYFMTFNVHISSFTLISLTYSSIICN